jgi:hypothetical protein
MPASAAPRRAAASARRFALAAALLLALAGAPVARAEDGYRVVGSYAVSGGALTAAPSRRAGVSASEARGHRAVWTYLAKVIPAATLAKIGRFDLFVYGEEPDWITNAKVSHADDGSTWELSVNYQEAKAAVVSGERRGLAAFDLVIVHEVAHLVALDQAQIVQKGERLRGSYHVDEGWLKPDAYLNLYYERFWKGRYPGYRNPDADGDAAESLRDGHPGDFITVYSAANPSEDFAECFSRFVARDRPSGDSWTAAKLGFFYAFPELVALRASMRAALASLSGLDPAAPVPGRAAGTEKVRTPAAAPAPRRSGDSE